MHHHHLSAPLVCLLATVKSLLAATIVYERGELRLQDPAEIGELILSPQPHTYLSAQDLPGSYDPNDVDGLTLVTSDLNQHIPQYCGSCWAHAPASSLADRIKLKAKGKGREVIPSIQNIIDCSGMGWCVARTHGSELVLL